MLNPTLPSKELYIDIDDSGPLEPFLVKCEFLREYLRSCGCVITHTYKSIQTHIQTHYCRHAYMYDYGETYTQYIHICTYEAQSTAFIFCSLQQDQISFLISRLCSVRVPLIYLCKTKHTHTHTHTHTESPFMVHYSFCD